VSDKLVSLYREKLAREKGTVQKDWGGRVSVALVYPNHYHVAMSNLGFQVVYNLLNRKNEVVAERAFLPDKQELSLHLETGKGLLSLESQSMLCRFDIVAFSLSFENDYPNILKILELARIPLLASDRDNSSPIVMAGGVASFLNPEPLADFFDLFLLGEAEATLDEFMDQFAGVRSISIERKEILRHLARNINSVYIPSFYNIEYNNDGTISSREPLYDFAPEKVKAARLSIEDLPVNFSSILTPETEFADRLLVELGRGCGRSCRFCAAGYVYRPPRQHEESDLLEFFSRKEVKSGSLGLLSASVLDTPGIENVFERILENRCSFSVSSLRADLLTPRILDLLKKGSHKSLAIAPEAGSGRLRRMINKHLSLDQITDAAAMIAKSGSFGVRLYFMIGLPTETYADIDDILNLIKKIRHSIIRESRTRGSIGHIRLSVNCFIPKPFTPFQWFPMEEVSTLKDRQKRLKKGLAKEGGTSVSFDVPKWSYVQTLFSTGDRRVGGILMRVHKSGGNWNLAFRHSDMNPEFFVYRAKGIDEILPWDFIDNGINKEFLKKEYELALREKESSICKLGECKRCGVCE